MCKKKKKDALIWCYRQLLLQRPLKTRGTSEYPLTRLSIWIYIARIFPHDRRRNNADRCAGTLEKSSTAGSRAGGCHKFQPMQDYSPIHNSYVRARIWLQAAGWEVADNQAYSSDGNDIEFVWLYFKRILQQFPDRAAFPSGPAAVNRGIAKCLADENSINLLDSLSKSPPQSAPVVIIAEWW